MFFYVNSDVVIAFDPSFADVYISFRCVLYCVHLVTKDV